MTAIHMKAVLLTVLANLLLCGGVFAGPTWLCSIASATAVDEDGTVGPPDMGILERPTFFRVDPGKKEVTLLAPESRCGETTKIDVVSEGKDFWMFSGVENSRVWSLIITAKGQVTLSVISDGVTWAVFGNALKEGKDVDGQSKVGK